MKCARLCVIFCVCSSWRMNELISSVSWEV